MSKRQSELVKQMNDKDVLLHLYLTQLMIIILAIIMGYFLFDSISNFKDLWIMDIKDILFIGGGLALFVICIDLIFMKILPESMFDDGGINEKVFKNRPFWHIVIISMVVSVAEEILFRGVIQTHFGLLTASIVFAILHIRYLTKWFLFVFVVSLSFLIGYVFEVTQNLWVVIFAHFLIDAVFAIIIRLKYIRESENSVEHNID